MKPTLIILAAGMGSRYGGLKQLDEVGPNGEAIIDYSLYDAIRAGFGKVVFVIRHDFEAAFKERFDPKLKGRITVAYVYQSLDKLPAGFTLSPERQKPWGTAHALLMADGSVHEPMAVINADDFYGRKAYQAMADFLTSSTEPDEYSMIGYNVENTLSDHGTVSRGVCATDANGYLTTVVERTKIIGEADGIFYYEEDGKHQLNPKSPVSMNFWGLKPNVFKYLKDGFTQFLTGHGNEPKSEYFIPLLINDNIVNGNIRTKVIECDSPWFGVTYIEDKPIVKGRIAKLIEDGVYPEHLW
ncbi:MAG: NTP transferase domain-containing protein [Bacteroidetes bacterium]|nr:NTP transferase domain-containing protein [Bacteroidota bacterium]MCL6103988.1 NTP transferase domain-containing protein [Bacteroidota bacterium]